MDLFSVTYNFFSHPFFTIFSGISILIIVFGVLLNIVFRFIGFMPLLWRLGYGRWSRKIAIVANIEVYNQLRKDLVDSGIFRANNIFQITSHCLSKIKEQDLLLVHYQSYSEKEITDILSYKRSKAGMIFYFPGFSPKEGKSIPDKLRDEINNKENTTIVNFRGRLLNDIVTTLITTSYEKR